MKHIIILTSFLLSSVVSHAQNLVPNFSFEQYDSCPTEVNTSYYEYSVGCASWGEAIGSVAYYNACDTAAVSIGRVSPWVGVPYNLLGHRSAYEGVAYVGICIYDPFMLSDRACLIDSIPALEIDTAYQVTIHVSLADSSMFAVDGFGVLFTTYGIPDFSLNSVPETPPQVDYTSYGIISDTANWTTLSGTFIADSAYTSLIIGGFRNYNDTDILMFDSNYNVVDHAAYYFIDNVVVEKLSTTGIVSINNNNDVNVYPNPFSDHATLLYNNSYGSQYSFSLFNTQGQLVQYTDGITSNRLRIERNGLPAGFYYYQLRNAYGIVANGKLIIK